MEMEMEMATRLTGSQNSDTNIGMKKLQLGEDSAEYGKRGDGESRANEQPKRAEANGDDIGLVTELVVQAVGDGEAKPKRQEHAGQSHGDGNFPVAKEEAEIDLADGKLVSYRLLPSSLSRGGNSEPPRRPRRGR